MRCSEMVKWFQETERMVDFTFYTHPAEDISVNLLGEGMLKLDKFVTAFSL
jgi:hypothetical protein